MASDSWAPTSDRSIEQKGEKGEQSNHEYSSKVLVITFMRNKVVELESKLKVAELEFEHLKSRPVLPFSQREEFLLGEIDLISRQLQGWPSSAVLRLLYAL